MELLVLVFRVIRIKPEGTLMTLKRLFTPYPLKICQNLDFSSSIITYK